MPFVVMQHAQSVECPSVPKILPLVGHNKVFMAVETAGNVLCTLGFNNSKAAVKSNTLVEFYTSVYLSAYSVFCVSSDVVFLPQSSLDF